MQTNPAILVQMKTLLLLALFTGVAVAQEPCKQVRVAVIDTGFSYHGKGGGAKLCEKGHVDFSVSRQFTLMENGITIPTDFHGHGTNIVGVIGSNAGNSDYCIMILKFYAEIQTGKQNLKSGIDAIKWADQNGADVINYSGGGPEFNEEEYLAVKHFLDRGGRFVAASGNNGKDIDTLNNEYYPAKYDKRIIVVGNLAKNGVRSKTSNYGKSVNRWEIGENIEAYGLTFSGTSQATATATGKIVSELPNRCDIGR